MKLLSDEQIQDSFYGTIDGGFQGRKAVAQAQLDADLEDHKKEVDARYQKQIGEFWYWQGDGEDHLESLTCPILITADDFRALIKYKKDPQEERNG